MLPKLALSHSAVRACALICLSLLLLASFCAPIHKHDTNRESSCLFCHATTRTEWHGELNGAERSPVSVLFVIAKYCGHIKISDAEGTVRIPRAPPAPLLPL